MPVSVVKGGGECVVESCADPACKSPSDWELDIPDCDTFNQTSTLNLNRKLFQNYPARHACMWGPFPDCSQNPLALSHHVTTSRSLGDRGEGRQGNKLSGLVTMMTFNGW